MIVKRIISFFRTITSKFSLPSRSKLEKKEEGEQTNKQQLKKGKKEVHLSDLDVQVTLSYS